MGCSTSKEKSPSAPADEPRMSLNGSVEEAFHIESVLKRKSAVSVAESLLDLTKGQKFHDRYVRPTLVSYGASCKVLSAYSKDTDRKVAVKTIPKSKGCGAALQRKGILHEVGIMKEVDDHPNAVKLLEVFDDVNSYYLVMDCCDGGELFEHITKSKDAFTERHAAQILQSLMLFLAHMHSKGIAHCDLKPENIMFDSEGAQGVVKVIDFGSSAYIQPDEKVSDAFGTVRYSSPEMAADHGIGQKTDVWSAGIVMYFMLCGSAPFLKKHEVDTLNYIKNKPKVKFSGSRWASISQEAKDCISAMLEVDPDRRPSAQEVLQMPWLRTQVPGTSISSDILGHLRSFANQSRMRRLLLGLMAANLSGAEANRLLTQFYSMDSDFSGTIELEELARVAKKALPDLADSEVENLFYALDLNRTGTVDVKEFFASLLHTMAPENQVAVARKSFVHLDRDHSGYVSKKAFVDAMVRQAMASGMCLDDTAALERELEQEFMALDANSDGQLSFEEFTSVLGLSDSDNNQSDGDAAPELRMPRLSSQRRQEVQQRRQESLPKQASYGRLDSLPEGTSVVAPEGGDPSCPHSVASALPVTPEHGSPVLHRSPAPSYSSGPAALGMPGRLHTKKSLSASNLVRLALVLQENTRRTSIANGSESSCVHSGPLSLADNTTMFKSLESPAATGSPALPLRPVAHVYRHSMDDQPAPACLGAGAPVRCSSVRLSQDRAAAAAAMAAAVAVAAAATSTSKTLSKKQDDHWPVDPARGPSGRQAAPAPKPVSRACTGPDVEKVQESAPLDPPNAGLEQRLQEGWFGGPPSPPRQPLGPQGLPKPGSGHTKHAPTLLATSGSGRECVANVEGSHPMFGRSRSGRLLRKSHSGRESGRLARGEALRNSGSGREYRKSSSGREFRKSSSGRELRMLGSGREQRQSASGRELAEFDQLYHCVSRQ